MTYLTSSDALAAAAGRAVDELARLNRAVPPGGLDDYLNRVADAATNGMTRQDAAAELVAVVAAFRAAMRYPDPAGPAATRISDVYPRRGCTLDADLLRLHLVARHRDCGALHLSDAEAATLHRDAHTPGADPRWTTDRHVDTDLGGDRFGPYLTREHHQDRWDWTLKAVETLLGRVDPAGNRDLLAAHLHNVANDTHALDRLMLWTNSDLFPGDPDYTSVFHTLRRALQGWTRFPTGGSDA